MPLEAQKCELSHVTVFRSLFLQEANTQIRHNACHERGWSDSYLLSLEGTPVGYGSVKGQDVPDRDTIFEFYVSPSHRKWASPLFQKLIAASAVKFIECQSNDSLLQSMIFEFSKNIHSPVILFSDHASTNLVVPEVVFRKKLQGDVLFKHRHEPEGSHIIVTKEEVVATGGFMLHYNAPFADLFMEVKEDARKRGVGSYLIQELKRECYLAGRVPAARCNIENMASRAILLKAGMKIAGFMLIGTIR